MEGAAQSLVGNVGQLLSEEYQLLSSIGGEVTELRDDLATMNALLRMQSEADGGSVNHFVREWMKQLREVGYDAEDCIHLCLFRVQCRLDDHLLVRTKRLLTTLWSRCRLAGDIKDLRALASAINEQHARYGVSLNSLLLGHPTAAGPIPVQAASAAARALRATADPGASAKALRVLESAVGCAEGRAALCEGAEEAVPAVVGKMMKAGRDGAEAAVAVLWAVCHRYRDRRAADAAAAAEGGLTRLLLVVQSGCSPAARQMALELLKMYRVNAKSCLAGYDSKTTHIMPF